MQVWEYECLRIRLTSVPLAKKQKAADRSVERKAGIKLKKTNRWCYLWVKNSIWYETVQMKLLIMQVSKTDSR